MMSRILLSLLIALPALTACGNPPYQRGSLQQLYPNQSPPQLRDVTLAGYRIHLAQMPGPGKTPILFIHGSPGDWMAWARYLDAPGLADFGVKIAVDRPGFGGSQAGQVMTDLRAQANLLAQLIPPGQPAIVVGHSLGGPLVAWLAIDHPDKVCGGLMLAGSVAPKLEAPRWYNWLAQTWVGGWVAPPEMLWSNREILALQTELEKLDTAWPLLQRPLIAMQGKKDELVDPQTVDYLETKIPAALLRVIRMPNQGHFIPWEQLPAVVEQIRQFDCSR